MSPTGLERAVAAALAEEPGVVAVYLFGSHAADRAHRESDIDIGVLLDRADYPTEAARFDARLRLTSRVAAALRLRAIDLALVERLSDLRKHIDHLRELRPRVSGPAALQENLSLHNDVLFSLLTVSQLVIDIAGELNSRRGSRFDD